MSTTYENLSREWMAKEAALCGHVAALVEDGVDYLEACAIVFGEGPTLDTSPAARRAWIDRCVKAEVKAMLNRLPWIRAGEVA